MPIQLLVIVNGWHALCSTKGRKQLGDEIVRSPSETRECRLGVAARFTDAQTAGELPLHSPYHRRQRVVSAASFFDSSVECCPLFVGLLLCLVGQVSLLLGVSFLLQIDA